MNATTATGATRRPLRFPGHFSNSTCIRDHAGDRAAPFRSGAAVRRGLPIAGAASACCRRGTSAACLPALLPGRRSRPARARDRRHRRPAAQLRRHDGLLAGPRRACQCARTGTVRSGMGCISRAAGCRHRSPGGPERPSRPAAVLRRPMEACISLALLRLRPDRPPGLSVRFAAAASLARYHLLRMPLHMLLPPPRAQGLVAHTPPTRRCEMKTPAADPENGSAAGVPRRRPSRGSVLADESGVLEHLLQFAAVVHLAHDVAATDEFALDVELRDGGPVGNSLMPWRISGSASTLTASTSRTPHLEDLHRGGGEAALQELGRALREHHAVVGDLIADDVLDVHSGNPEKVELNSREIIGVARRQRQRESRVARPSQRPPRRARCRRGRPTRRSRQSRRRRAGCAPTPPGRSRARGRASRHRPGVLARRRRSRRGRPGPAARRRARATRLEAHVALLEVRVARSHVGRIGHDELEVLVTERAEPVALHEGDARAPNLAALAIATHSASREQSSATTSAASSSSARVTASARCRCRVEHAQPAPSGKSARAQARPAARSRARDQHRRVTRNSRP